MNKKAIIFTIDALVAFSIFIAVTIAIYSLLTPSSGISIQSSAVYMNSENFLRASDKAENLSQAFEQIQLGNNDTATEIIQSLLNELPYPAEMRLNIYDGGALTNSLTVNEQDFATSVLLRKFLVLSVTENLGQYGPPYITVNASSSVPMAMPLLVLMWSDTEASNVEVTPTVLDSNGQQTGWVVMPQSIIIEFPPFPPPPQQPPQQLSFTVIIPPNAMIGEYNMSVQADNYGNFPLYVHSGFGHFNIIRYGIAELEVGTS